MSAVIPKGSLVLVTGVSGFIASHTADQLLAADYKVRGTVRSIAKGESLQKTFDEQYGKGKFEAFVVEDMSHDGAFDDAVKGVDGIIHLATIVTFSSNPDEVIPQTIAGATNILKTAAKTPSVKSFVYTSSSVACNIPEPNKKFAITKDTWNDVVVPQAWDKSSNPDPFIVYAASKTEAEKAVWKFVEDVKPKFQTVTVLPNANFGPTVGSLSHTSTGQWVPSLWKGDRMAFPPQYFVDVRDTARLHVVALVDSQQNGERIFAYAEPYSWNDVLAILREQNPEKKFLDDDPEEGKDLSVVPNEDAEALLNKYYKKGWTGLAESVARNTEHLK